VAAGEGAASAVSSLLSSPARAAPPATRFRLERIFDARGAVIDPPGCENSFSRSMIETSLPLMPRARQPTTRQQVILPENHSKNNLNMMTEPVDRSGFTDD